MKGTEQPYQQIFVEMSPAVALKDDALYLLVVRYDGSGQPNGVPPQYAQAGSFDQRFYWDDMVLAWNGTRNQMYTGWTGGAKNVVRLHMQGFLATGNQDLPTWEANSVTVYPNPNSGDVLSIDFNLSKSSKEVDVSIVDVLGNTLKTVKFRDIQSGTQQITISELANGYYFAKIVGQDGWRTKAFQVMR
jgi:hypothetical protein